NGTAERSGDCGEPPRNIETPPSTATCARGSRRSSADARADTAMARAASTPVFLMDPPLSLRRRGRGRIHPIRGHGEPRKAASNAPYGEGERMKRHRAAVLAALLAAGQVMPASASSHREAPLISQDP